MVHDVHVDWGLAGASRAPSGVLVIVDVLSFTTAVSVAVERGIVVHPAAAPDPRRAEAVGGVFAVGRREVTTEHPWSLSPAALLSAPAPAALVLPSPNGSTISAAAQGTTVAACLRNARAVAAWLAGRDEPITVIAAGERWPDGSLRPALEDLLGAGAVLAALRARRLSPEAEAASRLFETTPSVPEAVRGCVSGVELVEQGFGQDVEIAVQADASSVVPVLRDGAFRPASAH